MPKAINPSTRPRVVALRRKRERDHRRDLNLSERQVLAHLIEHADILDSTPDSTGMRWLLVPIPDRLLRVLEMVDADLEDMDDPEQDDDTITEPSLAASETIDQTEWAAGSYASDCDHELDESDDEHEWMGFANPTTACSPLRFRAIGGAR